MDIGAIQMHNIISLLYYKAGVRREELVGKADGRGEELVGKGR